MNPFLLFALLLAAWAVWRLARWAQSGGHLSMRSRRGTASGFSNAALSMQALYNPAAKNAIEQQQQEESRRDEEDDGAPPDPGTRAS